MKSGGIPSLFICLLIVFNQGFKGFFRIIREVKLIVNSSKLKDQLDSQFLIFNLPSCSLFFVLCT